MYKTHFLQGDLAQKAEYKKFSNMLTKLKTDAKRNYFDNQLKYTKVMLKNVGIAPFVTAFKTSKQTFNTQGTNNQSNLVDKAEHFNDFFVLSEKN